MRCLVDVVVVGNEFVDIVVVDDFVWVVFSGANLVVWMDLLEKVVVDVFFVGCDLCVMVRMFMCFFVVFMLFGNAYLCGFL